MRTLGLVFLPVSFLAACHAEKNVIDVPDGQHVGNKIYGGDAPDEWYHDATVALHVLTRGGSSVQMSPFCTGTLIAADVVLTAAHCVDVGSGGSYSEMNPNNVAIFVGEKASRSSSSSSYIWDHLYTVDDVVIHTSFNRNSLRNDIAVLLLDDDVESAEGITAVPNLPSSDGFTSSDVGSLNLNFAGYGSTDTGTYARLMQVDLTFGGFGCSVSGCASSGDTSTQFSYDQGNGGAYTSGTDAGPCSGDSGGPAYVVRGSDVYQGGITSWGDSRCTNYGVSTRVDAFESWLSTYVGSGDTGDTGTGSSCGDGTCDSGESCDGRAGTTSCSADCDGQTTGFRPARYCYIGSTCQGPGCP